MFFLKKIIVVCLLLLITSCSSDKLYKFKNQTDFSIEIETAKDKYNILFKENLKRLFSKNNSSKKYKLNSTITFQSSNTLSVSGTDVLKSTNASINYYLKDNYTNKIIKSGSINTFPALSSSSSSLYTKQKSIDHIKERLIQSAAKSLHMHIKIIISKLN